MQLPVPLGRSVDDEVVEILIENAVGRRRSAFVGIYWARLTRRGPPSRRLPRSTPDERGNWNELFWASRALFSNSRTKISGLGLELH